jgi:hypothetical protein
MLPLWADCAKLLCKNCTDDIIVLMLSNAAAIRTYFAKLGLATEIADIYIALHEYGPQSISQLSRNSRVERTRIYRLIDQLMDSNLIEVESQYKRGIIKAAPIANIRILITQKEQELQSLTDELELIEQVLSRNSISSPATRVQFYKGAEGIRQMQWNLFQAKSDISSIMQGPMQEVTGDKFWERWGEKWNQGDVQIRLLINEQFLKTSNAWHVKHPGHRVKNHDTRLLPTQPAVAITADIYDNVAAFYDWHGNDVYGVEIYNQQIADAQRVLFESLWQAATKIERDYGVKKDPA